MENRVWNLLETETLVSGTDWDGAKSTVRAMLFGKMVTLARDRVKYYRSDLFHDAVWIQENLIGAMSFDWICRESGTWCGDIVAHIKDDQYADSARYRFEISCVDDRKWVLRTYEAGPISPVGPVTPHSCEECGVAEYVDYVDYLSMWLCSDYCAGKVEVRLSKPIAVDDCDDEYYPYFSTEPLPEEVVERVMDMEPILIKPILSEGLIAQIEDELVETDVNPINWTIEKLMGGPKLKMFTDHEALPITECDAAYTAAGCIYHPAPPLSPKFRPITEDEKKEIVEFYFPTPSNESNDNRKVINMYRDSTVDSIRELLEEKLSDLNAKVEELNDLERELEDAKEIAERNVEAVEEAINSLNLDLEDFSFEADVSYSN